MSADEDEGKGGTSVVGLLLLVLMMLPLGIFAMGYLRLGPFGHMHGRSKLSEVKANLKAAYTAQKYYLLAKGRFSRYANEIGFSPERGNRFTYFLAGSGTTQLRGNTSLDGVTPHTVIAMDALRYPTERVFRTFAATGCPLTPCGDADRVLTQPGVIPPDDTHPDWIFLVAAAGNVDDDSGLACFSICSHGRWGAAGGNPAGESLEERAD